MAAWTPEELRDLASAPATEIWIGTVRAALRHAADLTDAAHAVRDEIERLREWNRQMVEKAASGGKLDGYRELGAKLANAEAEIERLRADLASVHQAITDSENQPSQYGTVTLAMYERLRAERDALRKDAERLDWLQRNPAVEISAVPYDEDGMWEAHLVTGSRNDREWQKIATGETLRSTLDAAMSALAQTGANDAG